jgi:aspartate racemase
MEITPPIGVIGGIGPQAGLDFVQKIFANTRVSKDQDHVNCVLISCPSIIPDRTAFLLQNDGKIENPAFGMFECARRLYMAGIRVAVVACNTAHSDRIFNPFCAMVKESLPDLIIVNMLKTCAEYIKETLRVTRVGLLATKGTHKSRVYHEYLDAEENFELMEPEAQGRERVHEAIYSEEYGIKAYSQEIKPQARDLVSREIDRLIDQGAEAVILGCTELPLAIKSRDFAIPVIDPGLLVARKLIELTAPEKLTKYGTC